MSVLGDIKKMQEEGSTEQEIIASLKQRGVNSREITEAVAQSKIKSAVAGAPEAPEAENVPIQGKPALAQAPPQGEAYEEMTPSLAAPEEPAAEYTPAEAAQQQYAPQEAQQQYAPAEQQPAYEYQQQYAPQAGLSTDTITEIAEQVVAEKINPLRRDIEKVIDLKTTFESKIEYLDERLKRIEKIIDRLQISILQKVGEYITNVDDVKRELVETQKSFKSITSSKFPQQPRRAPPAPKSPEQ